jgi:hypothetical protein
MADQCSKDEWSKDEWSKQEKAIAHRAYRTAYHRECASVLENVRGMAAKCDDPTSVWEIQDYLEKMQKKICEKYDFRYYVIISVFARLMYDGWLTKEDLAGIDEDKVQEICRVAEFYKKL